MKIIFKKTFSILLSVILSASIFSVYSFSSKAYENPAEHIYSDGENTLICYDGPNTLKKASEIYISKTTDFEKSNLPLAEYDKISFKANGKEVFVYATGVATEHEWKDQVNYTLLQRYTPVVIFDFSGCVDIEIDASEMASLCIDGASTIDSFSTATVSPISRNVNARVDGKKISFTIDESGDYTVVLDNDEKTAIHIFANDIEEYELGSNPLYITPSETGLPSGWESASALVFMPGEYIWDDVQIVPQNNQTVCLTGGAVLHSNIRFGRGITNARLVGRGILDDSESLSWKIDNGKPRYIPINCGKSSSIEISGISILNPCLWAVQLYESDNISIDNLHIITGKHNGDGISVQSSTNVTVTDSFIRGWDDNLVVKNYTEKNSSDILFKNITLWTDLAQSMEIGYETNNRKAENAEISNITFEDITVIYNFHKPVISIHNADDALVHGITYKNITVENANMGKGDAGDNTELIEISTGRLGYWAKTKKRGNIRDVQIDGVIVLKTDRPINTVRIEGADKNSTVENINLNNIDVCGEELTVLSKNGKALNFLTNKYTKNISINSTKYNFANRVIAWFINIFITIINLF